MKVGSKVVCIDGDFDADVVIARYGIKIPVEGEEYTVRGIEDCFGGTGIYLEEIINPEVFTPEGIVENCFDILHFREIETRPELSETTYDDIMTEIETKELQTA